MVRGKSAILQIRRLGARFPLEPDSHDPHICQSYANTGKNNQNSVIKRDESNIKNKSFIKNSHKSVFCKTSSIIGYWKRQRKYRKAWIIKELDH